VTNVHFGDKHLCKFIQCCDVQIKGSRYDVQMCNNCVVELTEWQQVFYIGKCKFNFAMSHYLNNS
jgi:hypothetical protein